MVPLLSRGRLVGVINLQHRDPHRYTVRQVRLTSAVGLLVGAEIELAREMFEKIPLPCPPIRDQKKAR